MIIHGEKLNYCFNLPELFIKNEKSFITKAYAYFHYDVQKYLFVTLFRVRQFLGIWCVALASKQETKSSACDALHLPKT